MIFTEAEASYLDAQDLGRLATMQPDGTLQANPVGFRNAELDTIDIGGYAMAASRKFRNLASHDQVAFVVDDIVSRKPWRVRCVEIRGHAETVSGGNGPRPGTDGAIIRVHPYRIISFGLDEPDRDPHLQTPNARTVVTSAARPGPERPALDDPAARAAVDESLAAFVAELQSGLDRYDADIYDRSFAADVLWGSPYGAILGSLDELLDVHRRPDGPAHGAPAALRDRRGAGTRARGGPRPDPAAGTRRRRVFRASALHPGAAGRPVVAGRRPQHPDRHPAGPTSRRCTRSRALRHLRGGHDDRNGHLRQRRVRVR